MKMTLFFCSENDPACGEFSPRAAEKKNSEKLLMNVSRTFFPFFADIFHENVKTEGKYFLWQFSYGLIKITRGEGGLVLISGETFCGANIKH